MRGATSRPAVRTKTISWLAAGAVVALLPGFSIHSGSTAGGALTAVDRSPAGATDTFAGDLRHGRHSGSGGFAGWTSHNWSGYALGSAKTPKGTYAAITGTWKMPTVAKSSGSRYSSQWIGIDGATNGDLIQTGTFAQYVKGKASYGVWWEILPSSGTTIHERIEPGDTISASIVENKTTKLWTITISDGHWKFVKTAHYSGKGQSAEWIVEAPLIEGANSLLADTSVVTFGDLTVNGATPRLVASDAGRMRQGGKIIEMPSPPAASGKAFAMAYGAKPPPPPS